MHGPEINRSYFFAPDNKRGWGNNTYFTYFSEFNRASSHDAYIEAGFLTGLFALSIIGNVFIIGFILYNKDLRTTTNYFVCNLALADILFVTSGPFIAHVRIMETWTLGEGMCHYMIYAMFVFGTVMIWTMAVISIDRYICISSKRISRRKVEPKYVFGICAIIWIVSFPLYCPTAIYCDVIRVATETGTISFCSLVWPRHNGPIRYSAVFTLCACTLGFIIPFVIIIVNYARIFKLLRTSRKSIAHASQKGSLPMWTNSIKQRNVRVVNTLVLLVVVFFIMLTPLFITFIFIQQDSHREIVPSHALVWTVIICYFKACINPFLYAYLNNKLKRGVSSVCKCKKRRISVSVNENLTNKTLSTVSEEIL